MLFVALGIAISRITVPFITETRFGTHTAHFIECPRTAFTALGVGADLPAVYRTGPEFWQTSADQACEATAGSRASFAMAVLVAAAMAAPRRRSSLLRPERRSRRRFVAAYLALGAAALVFTTNEPDVLLEAQGDVVSFYGPACEAAILTMLGDDAASATPTPTQPSLPSYSADAATACKAEASTRTTLALGLVLAAAVIWPRRPRGVTADASDPTVTRRTHRARHQNA